MVHNTNSKNIDYDYLDKLLAEAGPDAQSLYAQGVAHRLYSGEVNLDAEKLAKSCRGRAAFRKGSTAYMQGLPSSSNPYSFWHVLKGHWTDGWNREDKLKKYLQNLQNSKE